MLSGVSFLALAGTASAFVAPGAMPSSRSSSAMTMMAEKSVALPFLERPAGLGPAGVMAGDVGFDPLALSNQFPIEWLREAELKHGRICMLAVVGWLATDFGVHLPGDVHDVSTIEAHDAALKSGALQQLNIFISIAELAGAGAVVQMLQGSGRKPGDFSFDPGNFSKSPAAAEKFALQEITHCRLAMLAFSGIVTQAALGHATFPYM